MAKPKHGPALFDLLTDDEREPAEALKVPRWWGHEGPRSRSRDTGPTSARLGLPRAPVVPGLAVPEPAPEPWLGTTLEMDGDRVRVTFTSVTLAAVIFALLALVIGVFALGRWSGAKGEFARGFDAGRTSYAADAMSEIEAARRQTPASEVIGSLLEEPRPASQPASPAAPAPSRDEPSAVKLSGGVQWIPGHTYVVAQEFSVGRRDDALKAEAFLAQHGIGSAVVGLQSGATQLITTTGFDRDDPAQRRLADDLLRNVRAAGAAYAAAGGGYKLEGYFRKLKGENW